jgi:hypothetical protein
VTDSKGRFGNEKNFHKNGASNLDTCSEMSASHFIFHHSFIILLRSVEMFDRVITSDEMWCFQYDPETKRKSMQWKTQNSPWPKKARMSWSQVRNMLVCFFNHKGIVHYEFIAQGQMVNQQCYLEVLTRV